MDRLVGGSVPREGAAAGGEAVEAARVEPVGDHARHDPPDRLPPDPGQTANRGLRHLLRQPRNIVAEVARVRGARARPRHALHLTPHWR